MAERQSEDAEQKQRIEQLFQRGFFKEWPLKEWKIVGCYSYASKIEWPNFPCRVEPIYVLKSNPEQHLVCAEERKDTLVGWAKPTNDILPGILDGNFVLFEKSIDPRPNCELWIMNILHKDGEAMYGTKEEIDQETGEKVEIDTGLIEYVKEHSEELDAECAKGIFRFLRLDPLLHPARKILQPLGINLKSANLFRGPLEREVWRKTKQRITALAHT
ncbi:hypothetical protein MYX07_07245 [Patescibacteria group bacterium AH-259-L07]|nr:hypothetical protein [Patescibacteria group bacterium AH-259-L07]